MLKEFEPDPKETNWRSRPHAAGVPCGNFFTEKMVILDPSLCQSIIQQRQEMGIDKYDEVWDGVYVVPPLATNPHQGIVIDLAVIFHGAVNAEGRGRVLPGANVSDRRRGWEKSFRDPDVVVALNGGRAIDCGTHWFGGPDFLVEVQSPRDETDEKIPFYSQIGVRELLIVHRDNRELRLYRHDGHELVPVQPTPFQNGKWLVSEVIPFAFRRKASRRDPRTEVCRTDGQGGPWTV